MFFMFIIITSTFQYTKKPWVPADIFVGEGASPKKASPKDKKSPLYGEKVANRSIYKQINVTFLLRYMW